MKNTKNILKTINLSINDLIENFIKNKIITNINLFGIENFTINYLSKNNFHKIGYDDYFLLEKNFRIINSLNEVNLKIYYCDGVYDSNGIDFGGVRFLSLLKKISRNEEILFKKIEIFIDDIFNMHLIINNEIIFWLGRSNKKIRNNFKLLCMSSNFSYTGKVNHDSIIKSIKNNSAKITPENFLYSKYNNNMQIKLIINAIFKNFPNALED